MDLVLIRNTVLLLIITVAVVIDFRTTKIPNKLTFPAAALGILFNFFISGGGGALFAAEGWFLAALIIVFLGNLPLGPGGAVGGIGMGDAKLLAAVGAFLGPKTVLIVILYFCIFFGIIAMVVLARQVPWKQVGTFVSTAIFDGDTSSVTVDTTKLAAQLKAPIPISLAILAGTALTLCIEKQTLWVLGFQ